MSTIQFRSFAFVSLSLLALGCGDEPEKAQDKCESLVTTYCDRFVSCAMRSGNLGAEFTANDLRDECESFMLDNAHCEDAVRVSKNFGACVDDVNALSCDTINAAIGSSTSLDERYLSELPNACVGAVLYND